jgi:hypothetical protein
MSNWCDDEDVGEGVTMPFGKHAGEPISDLDTSYLAFLATECDIRSDTLRQAIEAELWRRMIELDLFQTRLSRLAHDNYMRGRANAFQEANARRKED